MYMNLEEPNNNARRCVQLHKRMRITTQEDSNNNARKLRNIWLTMQENQVATQKDLSSNARKLKNTIITTKEN
jgi:hypothetical protein